MRACDEPVIGETKPASSQGFQTSRKQGWSLACSSQGMGPRRSQLQVAESFELKVGRNRSGLYFVGELDGPASRVHDILPGHSGMQGDNCELLCLRVRSHQAEIGHYQSRAGGVETQTLAMISP